MFNLKNRNTSQSDIISEAPGAGCTCISLQQLTPKAVRFKREKTRPFHQRSKPVGGDEVRYGPIYSPAWNYCDYLPLP